MVDKLPLKLRDAEKIAEKDGLPLLPKENLTFGQHAADKLTNFAGSWTFIIIVLSLIACWISINILSISLRWDPWPFIVLNLLLSCLAALQAPIILMSANRAAQRDRQSQRYDYLIDRKTGRDVEAIMKELESIKKLLEKK